MPLILTNQLNITQSSNVAWILLTALNHQIAWWCIYHLLCILLFFCERSVVIRISMELVFEKIARILGFCLGRKSRDGSECFRCRGMYCRVMVRALLRGFRPFGSFSSWSNIYLRFLFNYFYIIFELYYLYIFSR